MNLKYHILLLELALDCVLFCAVIFLLFSWSTCCYFVKNQSIIMKKLLALSLFIIGFSSAFAQEKAYFYNIPSAPNTYTAENVAARMIDGLGFRYFWATEGLTAKDLAYKPNAEARTTRATLEHIYDLTLIIRYSAEGAETQADSETNKYDWETLRNKTLENLKIASLNFRKTNAQLENAGLKFKGRDGKTVAFPFWNLVNGPIEDAVWHTGQLVSFRRSSGNPLPSGVGFLQGTKH